MANIEPLVYERIKAATVAIVAMNPTTAGCPFTVLGSGFCVDPRGAIVTCRHVMEMFVSPESLAKLQEQIGDGTPSSWQELQGMRPFALFHHPKVLGPNVVMFPIPVTFAVSLTDFDIGMLRLAPHKAFPKGYPTLEIMDYAEVNETMPVGICGFPLGNFLQEQIGTVGSSFTTGILSSIIPFRGVPMDGVKGFQLNAAATNGNSGGPVFSTATGKVFGVLARAVMHQHQFVVQGLTMAEPVYQVFRNDGLERLFQQQPPEFAE